MSRILYRHKWMKLLEDNHGEAYVEMNGDAVMIIAVNGRNEVLLIREKSIAYGSPALTAPTGGVETDEQPEITANRELQEEVGYRARRLEYIDTLHPAVKYLRWKCHIYLARDLSYQPLKGDESSPPEVIRVPLTELNHLIRTHRISDSTTVAALCLVQQHLTEESMALLLNAAYGRS